MTDKELITLFHNELLRLAKLRDEERKKLKPDKKLLRHYERRIAEMELHIKRILDKEIQ